MASCGYCAQAHPGETCQNGIGNGRQSPAAFTADEKQAFGIESGHSSIRSDKQEQIDWKIHLLDGTVVRAHQHAARAKKEC
jgi:hypothetical protein